MTTTQATQLSTLQHQAASHLKSNGVRHSKHSQSALFAQIISQAGLTHMLEWEAPSFVLSHMLYKLGLPQKNKMILMIVLVRLLLHFEQVL